MIPSDLTCVECKGPRKHDGTLVCEPCFSKLTGIPFATVSLDSHRAVCGFYSVRAACPICAALEKLSPSAEVGASLAEPGRTSANSSAGGGPKQPI